MIGLAGMGERVVQHGVGQAASVVGGGEREEGLLAPGELEDRRSVHPSRLRRAGPGA